MLVVVRSKRNLPSGVAPQLSRQNREPEAQPVDRVMLGTVRSYLGRTIATLLGFSNPLIEWLGGLARAAMVAESLSDQETRSVTLNVLVLFSLSRYIGSARSEP